MTKIVLITGASSGFGRLTAEALAKAGHTVYGSMRQTKSRNAAVVEQMAAFSRDNGADLRAAEYEAGPYQGFGEQVQKAFAAIVPEDADVGLVAEAVVNRRTVRKAAVPRPHRSLGRRRRCRLHRARPRPRRDAAPGGPQRSAEAQSAGLMRLRSRESTKTRRSAPSASGGMNEYRSVIPTSLL